MSGINPWSSSRVAARVQTLSELRTASATQLPLRVPTLAELNAQASAESRPRRRTPDGGARDAAAGVRVNVYDYNNGRQVLARTTGGEAVADAIANKAFDNASHTVDWFQKRHGRRSWDGRGADVNVVVHYQGRYDNAEWDAGSKEIRFGDGARMFSPLGNALDVVAHEFTHAVIDSEVRLVYAGQQGALHESFADVFAALIDSRDDWKIGEDVFTPEIPGDALRQMRHPLYGSMSDLPRGGDVDVHYLSGIPNRAAVLVGDAIGRGAVGRIWYDALTNRLPDSADFSDAARATIDSAAAMYGDNSREAIAVRDAWRAVGVAYDK